MTDGRSAAIQYANDNKQRYLNELIKFASYPSISTDPAYKSDVTHAAEWVAQQLKRIGMTNVKQFPTQGHPIVYAESTAMDPQAPTVLIYGHYDVQPADPLEEWDSKPFQPTLREDNLFARGASDMKGQVMATLNALEAITRTDKLPINVKFLIEGEEEIGSPNLGEFIRDNKDLLSCDFALNPDTGMLAPDVPTVTYALRGLVYFEVHVHGPKQDLHSGVYGGVVHNPAQALCEIIAGMHDSSGRITLPGFYDDVRPLNDEEREELARLPMKEDFYFERTGVATLWGEEGYSPVERTGARPTLEVNGIQSGFTGEGAKTVLPGFAMAKLSSRLVPDQDPDKVHQQLIEYFETHTPATIQWEIIKIVGSPATISDRNSNWVQAYVKAAEDVWKTKPLFKREGGSVPVVVHFQEDLNIDSVNIGFALPSDNMHGPNEKLHLPTWYKGIEALIHFFYNVEL
ncbi:MAG: dipeptidase [Anaerolineales bacterium]|jgi:acetylornithine deacetylase/succinyl-diaminopimelate desuccinylase-like protein